MDQEFQNNESNTQNTSEKSFAPPRHWVGVEELEAKYWADSEVKEKRGQEFFKKPVELIDQIDRMDQAGIARRDFLTIMGASMAMASFACARRPVHKIIPYVVKPEEITPGVPTWYASTNRDTGYGILVKNREGRPIKIEGNPDHPVNQGAISARDQASVLSLYDPDRLKAPAIRNRSGGSREVSWTEVDALVQGKVNKASRVRILSGEIQSESTQRLIREFLAIFPNSQHVVYEPLAMEDVVKAQEQSYGTAVLPNYRFDQANVIVSLGADFLGTWPFAVEYSRLWAKNRKLNSSEASQAKLSKLVCFESTMTITGANADERYPVRPGDEYKIALAIAHELIVTKRHSALANDSTVTAALKGYSPKSVASLLRWENGDAVIKKVAQELLEAKGKSLVVAGGIHSQTEDAVALQVAVNLLNTALENEGVTVDGTAQYATVKSRVADFLKLVQEMKLAQVDLLIVYRSNPAYAFPQWAADIEAAFKKVPFVIAVGEHEDETALLADCALPDHHYLENWGDSNPKKGIHSVQQPVIAPIHSSRAFEDSLIIWAKGAAKGSGLIAQSTDWHNYLQNNWRESIYRQYPTTATFDQFWEGVLRQGVFNGYAAQGILAPRSTPRNFVTSALNILPKNGGLAPHKGTILALYTLGAMYDGREANNAWLQELPDPVSAVTWDNFLNVGPQLAQELGLKENDVVQATANGVSVELPVHIQPGMHAETVSVAVGYGRKAAGRVGRGTGIDVYPLAKVVKESLAYSGHPVTLKKTGRIYQLASTQWHTVTENRPIINDITLEEFRKDPSATGEVDPELRPHLTSMWSPHEYKGYRWAMAIDLNSCIGCGACAIACQAENNIPVVGRDQVRNSRQMHWIRIDRYYSGSSENPDVVFQPMLCQQCENAPCENVCPVLATVHDDEGLNVQVYNRCVGTRYCQNNCPYKVRRFNFFDHWKTYEGTMNLVWNPDVTVRTRGIMEKCTFCVQRIRDAKDQAKDNQTKVRDGDLKTACQQTCPTEAIIFGDINDPQSRVSKLRQDQRAFRVLDVLNTKPMVSYMTKVRNKEHS